MIFPSTLTCFYTDPLVRRVIVESVLNLFAEFLYRPARKAGLFDQLSTQSGIVFLYRPARKAGHGFPYPLLLIGSFYTDPLVRRVRIHLVAVVLLQVSIQTRS